MKTISSAVSETFIIFEGICLKARSLGRGAREQEITEFPRLKWSPLLILRSFLEKDRSAPPLDEGGVYGKKALPSTCDEGKTPGNHSAVLLCVWEAPVCSVSYSPHGDHAGWNRSFDTSS